jgi:hypothetical protein
MSPRDILRASAIVAGVYVTLRLLWFGRTVFLLGFFGVLLWFGFMGLLLAVPLLATAMVPIKMLYVRDVVGDEVSVPGDDTG